MGKDTDTGRKDDDDQNDDTGSDDDDDDDNDGGGDDEAGWQRLGDIVDQAVGKRFEEWSAQQAKMKTSSRSPRKPEKKPTRKQGFLSSQFFSGLTDQE